MNTRHLVDPQMVGLVDALPPMVPSQETLTQARAMTPHLFPPAAERDDLTIRERYVPGPDNAPDVRVIVTAPAAPADTPLPALLWIHGGGYVAGTAEQSQATINEFVDECIRYAQRLLRAGVPTELHVQPGAVHGYMVLDVDAGRRLRHEVAEVLRTAFAK